MQTLATTKNK